jgi:hypothetical protein
MQKPFIFFLTLLACLFPWTLFAAAQNCQPLSIQSSTINLTTLKPVYVVFHNTSMHNIYMTHPSSLGSSLIEPDKWSMLVLVEKNFSLACVESLPGHEQVVSCDGVLTVCQFSANVKDSPDTKWLAENAVQPPQVDQNTA